MNRPASPVSPVAPREKCRNCADTVVFVTSDAESALFCPPDWHDTAESALIRLQLSSSPRQVPVISAKSARQDRWHAFPLYYRCVRRAENTARNVVLLLGTNEVWRQELLRLLNPEEWDFVLIADPEELPARLRTTAVQAILMTPRSWSGRELLILHECRVLSPQTALVVMAENPVEPALKRAFENGATTFLRWPTSPETMLQAIHSGRRVTPSPAPGHLKPITR